MMEIIETVERRKVGVDGNDEYGVDLWLGKKRVSLTLGEAGQLREAIAAVELEQTMARNQDERDRADRLAAHPLAEWEKDVLDGLPIGHHADAIERDER